MSKHDIDVEREVMGLNDEDAEDHKRWAEGKRAVAILKRDWCPGSGATVVRSVNVVCRCGHTIQVDPTSKCVLPHLVSGVMVEV